MQGIFYCKSAKMQAVHPLCQLGCGRAAVQQLAGAPIDRIRAERMQDVVGLAGAATARGTERHDRLAGKVIAFQKGVDNCRRDVPPDRELKCSPSSPALENTGLNGLHKCVFCSF